MCECVCGEVGGPGMNFQLPGSLHPPRCGSILFSANGSVSPYRVFIDRRRETEGAAPPQGPRYAQKDAFSAV